MSHLINIRLGRKCLPATNTILLRTFVNYGRKYWFKIGPRLERFFRDKPSRRSLLTLVNYGHKSFITLGPGEAVQDVQRKGFRLKLAEKHGHHLESKTDEDSGSLRSGVNAAKHFTDVVYKFS